MSDITINNQGTIVLITPVTNAGQVWMWSNVESESWQWVGPSLAVDQRYADAIAEGAMGDGLNVTSEN